MKTFKFRLQTKLNIASLEEQLAKEAMQLRVRDRDLIQSELEELIDKQLEIEQSIKRLMQEGFSVDKYLIFKDYLPVLKKMRTNKEQDLDRAEQAIESARLELIEKTRETQTLIKLKDKEWHLYLQELQKEEQKVIDEIAINSHYRKNLV
jgi:flagellar FliJ protein